MRRKEEYERIWITNGGSVAGLRCIVRKRFNAAVKTLSQHRKKQQGRERVKELQLDQES
jgi:hypothetical protein